ncbi:hypothetical protein FRB97_004364 [Tulasnella sp. 331]|nr:hypothetical protein FRB97_004364 [Tulasnella sp. 331]KAG8878142.1 hypothetical protein FRB98_006378 [Tulasnella sp. 332]
MPRAWSGIITVLAIISALIGVSSSSLLIHRQTTTPPTPYFPSTPASCPICAATYPNISSCASAAYLFQNFTQIMLDPTGFTDLIGCACTDTFESVFPQCVDCFIQTNQTAVLQSDNLPSVVSGLRQVCALASTIFGHVASANSQLPSETAVSGTPIATAATTTVSVAVPVTVTASSSTSASTSAARKGYQLGNTSLLGFDVILFGYLVACAISLV